VDAATRGFEALFEKVSGAMDGASQAPQGWVHGRLSQTGFKYPSHIHSGPPSAAYNHSTSNYSIALFSCNIASI